jgi:hypothetical protein
MSVAHAAGVIVAVAGAVLIGWLVWVWSREG